MKSLNLGVIGLVLAGGISLGAWMQASAKSQQEPEAASAPEDQSADQPGPMHKQLMALSGEWITSTTFEMDGQMRGDAVAGIATLKSILDGRFLQQDESGTMNDLPFKATKIWGYNRHSNKYETTWLWTNDTATLRGEGTSDDGGKTIRLEAGFEMEDGQSEAIVVTLSVTSVDAFDIEIASKEGTKPFVRMVTKYSRKK
ncbi:MAG TPA: DUF1579 family protein [Phycisphaerales bacterium]|nr:DUF1579 family protein [Phycisphaerales bacterium]